MESRSQPTAIVIGGGLAGLTCAFRLHQGGFTVTGFEAQERLGGRCWTARDLADGQVSEHGGELIDPSHERILGLIAELGLDLEDRAGAASLTGKTKGRYVFGGTEITNELIAADAKVFYTALQADVDRMGPFEVRYDRATDATREIDAMTVDEWLADRLGDTSTLLCQLLISSVNSLYGDTSDRLSAITLFEVYFQVLHAAEPSILEHMESSLIDQTHVRGGNDLIVSAIADRLAPGTFRLNAPLEQLWRLEDGAGLAVGGEEYEADVVVLALPFPALRNVDIDRAGFEGERLEAIRHLNMGRNTKLMFKVNRPLAAIDGWRGLAASDDGGEDVFIWDSTSDQPGESAILTIFTAEPIFDAGQFHGPAGAAARDKGRRMAEALIPGISAALDGPVWLDSWPDNPWIGGSFAAFLAGQVTRWNGLIAEPDGPFLFCGEHTARYWQGYLEGAVESGERAATEAVARMMR